MVAPRCLDEIDGGEKTVPVVDGVAFPRPPCLDQIGAAYHEPSLRRAVHTEGECRARIEVWARGWWPGGLRAGGGGKVEGVDADRLAAVIREYGVLRASCGVRG